MDGSYWVFVLQRFSMFVEDVVAMAIAKEREAKIEEKKREAKIMEKRYEEENRVLYEMSSSNSWTLSEMAQLCGFMTATGFPRRPMKTKVLRVLRRLKDVKLVGYDRRRGWYLTQAGRDEAPVEPLM